MYEISIAIGVLAAVILLHWGIFVWPFKRDEKAKHPASYDTA
jgi:hypothetical protein